MISWRSFRDRLLLLVAPRLAYAYMTLVGATSRLIWHGDAAASKLEQGHGGCVFALWHGRQVFFTYSHRNRGIATLVSRSKDGELIAEVLRLSGHRAVRGSSSRGGAAALKELVEAGREGHSLAVTPDGPRGPVRRVQPGVLFLARELGIPIVPAANGMRRKLIFRGWDEFHFPLPFNRVAIVLGKPLPVGPDDDLEAKAEELRLALDAVTAEADRIAYAEN